MDIRPTAIADVLELVPKRHGDSRGWFSEVTNKRTLASVGIEVEWIQDNESFSAQQGTIRGIHFQIAPNAQHKLIRVVSGSILDVAVDLRRDSPTFAKHTAITLTAAEGNQVFLPAGFGHAFCTTTHDCLIAYKVAGSYYAPESERNIAWNDPAFGINWPVTEEEVELSAKDRTAPLIADAPDLF